MVLNFLRFRQRPPGKTPPPNNRVDVFHDAETGKLVARDSQGNPVLFDSAAGGATWGVITGTLASQADLQGALNAKAASSHTHVSADITDALSDASEAGSNGKILKVSQFALSASTVTVGAYVAKSTGVTTTWAHNRIESTGAGAIYAELPFGAAAGMLPVLRMYADSTAANAAVSVGDAWWDTTLNKARVRLT
jgi:hypothetical protein